MLRERTPALTLRPPPAQRAFVPPRHKLEVLVKLTAIAPLELGAKMALDSLKLAKLFLLQVLPALLLNPSLNNHLNAEWEDIASTSNAFFCILSLVELIQEFLLPLLRHLLMDSV